MPEISLRLQQVYEQIANYLKEFNREPDSVQLVAVSKTQPLSALHEAIKAGLTVFGENYLQEALIKMAALKEHSLEWHFIGPIQSNKTGAIASGFDWVHSIDRFKIAQHLSRHRPSDRTPLQVLIQVNTSGESSKSGCRLDELAELSAQISSLPGLQLRGLMTLPAPIDDFEQQRRPFRQLREALQTLKLEFPQMDTLSMGMSNDLRAAIAEGATMVRLGTAIFGPRKS